MISKKAKALNTEKSVEGVLLKVDSIGELHKLHKRLTGHSIWSEKLYETISFQEAKERTATMLSIEAENDPDFFSQLCDEYSVKSSK